MSVDLSVFCKLIKISSPPKATGPRPKMHSPLTFNIKRVLMCKVTFRGGKTIYVKGEGQGGGMARHSQMHILQMLLASKFTSHENKCVPLLLIN